MRILKAILLCALIALIGALAAVLLLHREDISAYIASARQEAAWRDYAYSRARVPKELKGVSILLVGDSFIAGWEPEQHDYLWSTLMDTQCGMDVVCAAVTGSTVTLGEAEGYVYHGSYEPYVTRELPDRDFDIVLVQGGMNDWMLCAPYGSDDSRDVQTIKGAMNTVLDRLEGAYPDSLILAMSAWVDPGKCNYVGYTAESYDQAVQAIYAARGIPCFTACDPKISGIYADDPDFRVKYFRTPQDSWHLSEAGHRRFLPVITTWIYERWKDYCAG